MDRFDRHRRLPGWSDAAQDRIAASRVLVVGCGGLGGPAALHLAGAGVGTLVLSDHDVVEVHDLHRQVHFTEADVGRSKTQVLAARVAALHGGTQATGVGPVTPATVGDLLSGVDVVVDATDDQATHLLLNDACLAAGVPLVAAGVHQWEGHVTTITGTPCLRCLHPSPPAPRSCAEVGVMGPLVSVIGAWQAAETIKVLTGGPVLSGRMVLVDLRDGTAQSFTYAPRGGCPACTGTRAQPWILDVRGPDERDAWHVPGSHHIPLDELASRLAEVPRDMAVLVHCAHGARAARAVRLLQTKGIDAAVLAGARAWGQT